MTEFHDYRCGLDIGSTTIKIVLLEGNQLIDQQYRRHNADIAGELDKAFGDLTSRFPGIKSRISVTGSGGLSVSKWLNLPFVQEVIAETQAIRQYNPETDIIIELGGEDAKITYLHPVPEQRMNGTCAGGTGAFIDQMAALLQTDASGLDDLAAGYQTLYPIASRCGVFAKSDLQPLINEGAARSDLAASVFQAVVNQTIAGLACGRPIRGHVIFLGGPLYFLPQLRKAFERSLSESVESFTTPANAQLYVAIGAALLSENQPVSLDEIRLRFQTAKRLDNDIARIRPLFQNDEERSAFTRRHDRSMIELMDISITKGPCFLGIDAGSTTTKAVLINDRSDIVFTYYAGNQGNPIKSAVTILKTLYEQLPDTAWIARSCVTGYGEQLIKAALNVDAGEIETMAHYQSASYFCPDVSFIIDIGGQDMKCMRIRDGVLDSIMVNEACSSGCGSFISTFAETLKMDAHTFSLEALSARNPVDLGTRCTVFMNSRVKQAQKEGATVGEISAGLSYSVVRNALYKVIKLKDPSQMGEHVVVQGGTFLNDAILRCFELVSGKNVIRPNIAGLMGAFGAALIAKKQTCMRLKTDAAFSSVVASGFTTEIDRDSEADLEADSASDSDLENESERSRLHVPTRVLAGEGPEILQTEIISLRSRILTEDALSHFGVETEIRHCNLCANHCKLTVSAFSSGERFISGNRCERGAGADSAGKRLPDLFDYKYQRLFAYPPLSLEQARRGVIGIPRVLNIYENYPLWLTILTALGYRVILSGRSDHKMFLKGMDTIPSESVCYPAKLVHGHVTDLIEKGIRVIFYPDIPYEQKESDGANNHYNCPIVSSYPEVIRNNIEQIREQNIRFLNPFLPLTNRRKLVESLRDMLAFDKVTLAECRRAVELGFEEYDRFKQDIRQKGAETLKFLAESGQKGIVLAGRPYHIDPEVHHGVPQMITSLGLTVLTEDSVAVPNLLSRPIRVVDQWAYHTRLYEAAAFVADHPELELVQLNSFGCGLDAVTTDQVQEILEASGKIFTVLKIDEVSNLGAARIRMRSLKATMEERAINWTRPRTLKKYTIERVPFTKQMKESHTILAPQMSPIHFRFIESVLNRNGYKTKILEKVSPEDIETGLKFVNNDACYPSIIVVGQLVNAFINGGYDPDRCSVFITQTGGGCRATNYVAFLRKALKDAGFSQVPVVALSASGIESNPGVVFTPRLIHQILQGVALGDLLQNVLMRVRPYESEPGSAIELYHRWDQISRECIENGGNSRTLNRRISFSHLIDQIVSAFDCLPLKPIERKPRVGLVGEILVKFHPDANNHAVDVIESEGCEAVLPGLLDFFLYCFYNGQWRHATLGTSLSGAWISTAAVRFMESYRSRMKKALARTKGKFFVPESIDSISKRAQTILSLGNDCGEGWFLTGEMLELIESGVPNIICAQPFACLPNHVTGKGMIKELRRQHPKTNIVPIDYDPGASEVNQLNRIKLMIATAFSNHELAAD